jgi:hypothetical protein
MTEFSKKNYLPFVFLFVIVFITRLPFLYAGYGVEEDSWAIALAAFHTKCTGVYEPSRLPGHPFQEYIYSLLWGGGPILFNGLCALFSAIGAVFFALILKQLKFNRFFLAAFAFSMVPVYYISSTYTIDFVWTEALILIALYAVLKNKYVLAGIILGLAVGCRVTSGVMLLPFMIIIWQDDFKKNFIHFLKMSLPMGVVAIALYLPIYLQFGSSFFMYYDQFPYPPFSKVMYKMIIGVFGLVGTISIGVFFIIAFLKRKHQNAGEAFAYALDKKMIIASVVVIILYIISYFRLPQKSGYMIPIIPFLLILFGYYLNRKNFNWLCWGLCLSSFIFSINLTDAYRGSEYSKYAMVLKVSGQELFLDPFTGPIFSDYSKRKQKMAFTDLIIRRSEVLSDKTVIIAGWWYNEIMVTQIGKPVNKQVVFEGYINDHLLEQYHKNGYRIFYLPEQNKYNDLMYKMQVTDHYARSFME